MIINIIGCDGCGKSTQVSSLLDWYSRNNISASAVSKRDVFNWKDDPNVAFLGSSYQRFAYELLPAMDPNVRAMMLTYINYAVASKIQEMHCEVFLLDGFWHKHFATEVAQGTDPTWMKNLSAQLVEPDLTILIDLDPIEIAERGHEPTPYEAGCDFDKSIENFVSHQRKMRSVFLEMAREENYHIVSGSNPQPDVFNEIVGILASENRLSV